MTHYEVLGVEPGAEIDEIRAAYRARARDLHPDRRAAEPDAVLEMAAVNQAWAVLGDPRRRAEYDRSLRPGDNGDRAGASWDGGSWTGDRVDGSRLQGSPYSEAYPPPVHSAMPGCFGSGALPWLALVVVLVVIFIFTAYAGSGDDPGSGPASIPTSGDESEPPMVAVRDVRGMCIRVASGINSVVDCFTVPNEGRIVAQAAIGGACPEGTEEWLLRHLDTLACTEATTAAGP